MKPTRVSGCRARLVSLLSALTLTFAVPISASAVDITAASYDAPTTRYGHAVLGDAVEYGALVMRRADGSSARAVLPENLVFEDTAPRLWDVTGDGSPEVVVVEADQRRGARLAVWNADGRLATTPFIGTRFRWLAPVAAADLDGDGAIEIAYVDRPHLAKTLRVWRFSDGGLREVASMPGVSNHRIGWDYIESGLRDCGNGPELILATGDWRQVLAIRFDGALTSRPLSPYSANAVRQALACR